MNKIKNSEVNLITLEVLSELTGAMTGIEEISSEISPTAAENTPGIRNKYHEKSLGDLWSQQ